MKRVTSCVLGIGLASSLGLTFAAPTTAAEAPPQQGVDRVQKDHDLPNPLEDKRRELREQAVASVVSGEAKPVTRNGSTVVKVGEAAAPADAATLASPKASRGAKERAARGKRKDQYVELSQERADKVFVILAEFGDERHPDYPDADTDPSTPGPEKFDGPQHNQIEEPDRTKDNSTVWQPDYDRQHYQDLYFKEGKGAESVKTYYETQSSGRYTVDGTVSDWVKVKYNTARYGRDDASTWNLIQDATTQWVADQRKAGRTDAQIKQQLAEYDVYDRYDYDGDGDFNEPDGYIDHFQIVHAGHGEEDGDATYGEDAIWSHRWYAFLTDQGVTGPSQNRLGGTQIGVTTSACPTRTARRAATTATSTGRSWRSRDSTPRARPSASARATWARGRSCSSAGSTTRSSGPRRSGRSSSGPRSTTPRRRREPSWCSRRRRSPVTWVHRQRARSSSTPAPVTTSPPR